MWYWNNRTFKGFCDEIPACTPRITVSLALCDLDRKQPMQCVPAA